MNHTTLAAFTDELQKISGDLSFSSINIKSPKILKPKTLPGLKSMPGRILSVKPAAPGGTDNLKDLNSGVVASKKSGTSKVLV